MERHGGKRIRSPVWAFSLPFKFAYLTHLTPLEPKTPYCLAARRIFRVPSSYWTPFGAVSVPLSMGKIENGEQVVGLVLWVWCRRHLDSMVGGMGRGGSVFALGLILK